MKLSQQASEAAASAISAARLQVCWHHILAQPSAAWSCGSLGIRPVERLQSWAFFWWLVGGWAHIGIHRDISGDRWAAFT